MALTKTALFALAMLFFSVSALGYCMFKQSEDLKRYVLVLTKKVVALHEQIKQFEAKRIRAIKKKEAQTQTDEDDDEDEDLEIDAE